MTWRCYRPIDRRATMEGQSNCLGVGRMDALTGSDATLAATDFARVYIWNPASGAYEKLRIGTNNQSASFAAYCSGGTVAHPEFGVTFGPELGLALRWMRETVKGNLYIDKNTGDGQPISYFQSGGAFYTSATSRRTAANAWLATRGIRVTDMGWLWVQGEGNSSDSQASYQAALTTYITSRIASNLSSSVDFRILAQISSGNPGYGAGVSAAKAAYAAANPTVAKVVNYAVLYNPDGIHLNTRGQLQLGYDAFEILFSKPHLGA